MAAVASEVDTPDPSRQSSPEATDAPAQEPGADLLATAKYLTYRGLGAAMGHMPLPLAQGVEFDL